MEELIKSYKGKIPGSILKTLKKEALSRKLTKKDVEKVLLRLKQIYERAKINAGEAIGVITAESFGEPSTQMSIAKNEKIIIKIKNEIKIIEIGKLIDGLMGLNGSLKLNGSEILSLNDFDIYAPSLNQEEKIEWKKIVECSRHKTNKKLLKLITRSGRSIVATDNHSFVIRKDNEVKPILGKELSIGDRIPVISYLPENCIEEIKLEDHIKINQDSRFKLIHKGNMLLRNKTLTKPIPNLLELDRQFGYFMGAYLAEGNATNGQVSISNINDNFMNNIKDFTTKLGVNYVEDYHSWGFSISRDLKINSSLLANFLINSCRTGSRNKIIPDFCFSAKEEFVSGLLKGYFDGDGNFTVNRKMIRVSSNSKELIDGISLLLTRFRIFSYKVEDKKNQFWLLIPYKYAPLFLLHIGSDIDYKIKALEELTEKAKKFWNENSNDYNDMVSGFGNLLYDVAKKLKYPTRYVNNFTKRQKIGRTSLFRYIKLFDNLAKKKKVDISLEIKIMNRMFNSDVVWDEIVNIEYVNNNEFVYDLSVPGLETFTTFDGVITHNTLNVFHFAGVAEMSVSLGLPRLIEIFDARKEIKTPLMNVYIKSPWNKDPLKVKKIAASIKEIKLKEVSSSFVINIPKLQIEVALSKKKMRNLNLSEDEVCKAVAEGFPKLNVKLGTEKLVLKPKSEENQLIELYKLKEKAKTVYVSGVKGVKQVLPVKSGNEFMILTAGSNLKEVFRIKEVDETKTATNDIHEIKKVLGVEAARQAIINESSKVMNDQGLDIDIRHIMFISDVITSSGFIKGITRSGITGEKESVLARASFETPIKHIVNASLIGEEDSLNSVIENVILNQPVPLGTGLPDLVIKMKEVEK